MKLVALSDTFLLGLGGFTGDAGRSKEKVFDIYSHCMEEAKVVVVVGRRE